MWEIEIQRTVYNTLRNDATVSGLVSGVYDNAPQRTTTFPYITIGEANHLEWDTDTELGIDAAITVHVWSRKSGRKETKTIQSAIYNALNRANLAVSGYHFVSCDFLNSESFMDDDGETRHGISNFRMLVDET